MMWLSDQMVAGIAMIYVYVYNYFATNGFVYVEIDKGILRGRNATMWRGAPYFSFKGIPYAKPPVGESRFKGPQEETAWAGVRDAGYHGQVCPHVDIALTVFKGQEDCLFLNVYTPTIRHERLPVMVWIHGGMFMLGSADDELFGPDYFVEAGVVLVTMNYRLGALGFLSTEDDGAPGNAGLKDQVAALKWVRRNIARFGGDPNNVTIFGGSSGAACAHFHILSPMSSGLFARAISQSGTALNRWSLTQKGPELTIRLAEALGAENVAGNKTKALQFLQDAPYEDIVRAQGSLITAAEKRMLVPFLFVPSVEKGVTSEEVFLPESPLKILESGNFTKVPYITGYTSEEGDFFVNDVEDPNNMKRVMDEPECYVPSDIENEELRSELADSMRKFYFDDKPIALENITNFVDLYTDNFFLAGIRRATKLHMQLADSPIYFYVFSYDGGMNHVKFFVNADRPGSVHGDELGYLFHFRLLFWRTPVIGSVNEYVIRTMIRLWTNFARFGNPTPAGDPLTWKPATTAEFNFLNISGRDTKLGVNPDPARSDFWADAYEKSSARQHEDLR